MNHYHHILQILFARVRRRLFESTAFIEDLSVVVVGIQTGCDVGIALLVEHPFLDSFPLLEGSHVVEVGTVPMLLLKVAFQLLRVDHFLSEVIVLDPWDLISRLFVMRVLLRLLFEVVFFDVVLWNMLDFGRIDDVLGYMVRNLPSNIAIRKQDETK